VAHLLLDRNPEGKKLPMDKNHENDLIAQAHNNLFINVFGQENMAADFFCHYLPQKVVPLFDFSKLKRCHECFVDAMLKDRQADLLFEVPFKNKDANALIYILAEHQSSFDPMMAYRLLCYINKVWEWWRKNSTKAKKLPAILPFVLYHGQQPWRGSLEFIDCIQLEPEEKEKLKAYIPNFRFMLTDLCQTPDEGILGSAGCRLSLLSFKYSRSEDLEKKFKTWDKEIHEVLIDTKHGWYFLEVILKYLMNTGERLPAETVVEVVSRVNKKAEEAVMTIAEQLRMEGRAEGIEKGRAEGKAEGKAAILLKMLQVRFGSVSKDVADRIHDAKETEIESWSERLFFIQKPEEIFSDKGKLS
jgi:predicted transposase/invertase (TIGR01784 family)